MDTIVKKQIKLNFNITPVACARPRLSNSRVYTPKSTFEYKKTLATILNVQLNSSSELTNSITYLYHKPICLIVSFYMPIPKSLIRKNSSPWKTTLPTTKPDTDNLIKSVKDVLTGQIFKDDSQVTYECVRKIYSERPRVEILIQEANIETLSNVFLSC